MDPVSRRKLWKIIEDLRTEEKTVILTTQFLDEAEELADRIGIMAKGLNNIQYELNFLSGKMFALGSTEFIKKEFGHGYNLIIQNNK